LNTEYRGSDVGIELYVIEQYHDYQMGDRKSVIIQVHEMQCMVKELSLLKIIVPDEFVAGDIIGKLPPSWRDFATTIKHKRVHMSISDFIISLDVEEKARIKNGRSKGAESQTSANMVHQPQSHDKVKCKAKQNQNNNKPNQTTTFKKKKNKEDKGCFVCGSHNHWAKKCPNQKEENLNLSRRLQTWFYLALELELVCTVIYPMFFHMCSDASLFSSNQVASDSSMMMGNWSHTSVHGVSTIDLKLTSGKIVQPVPSICCLL
jgi:hypothetical protein